MLAARAFVGLGEGAALPVMNNLVATNIAPGRRATALGGCFSGFHTGNLVGLVLAPLLLARVGWRGLFYTFGLLGAPLLVVWLATVPPQMPRVSGSASGAGRAPLSTLQLMSKSATWAIIVVNIVNHWGVLNFLAIIPLPCYSVSIASLHAGYFIYLNWLPTYFYRTLGMDLRASSYMAFIPWLTMAVGCSVAGVIADGLVSRGIPATQVTLYFRSPYCCWPL